VRGASTSALTTADDIDMAFENYGAASEDIDLIVATDAEQILGIGDWGVGGIADLGRQARGVHRRRGNRPHPGDPGHARRRHRPR